MMIAASATSQKSKIKSNQKGKCKQGKTLNQIYNLNFNIYINEIREKITTR
jgi:hypothetical protein